MSYTDDRLAKRTGGASSIAAWVVFAVCFTMLIFAVYPAILNLRMELLCRKDGGVKVYETVAISKSEWAAMREYPRDHPNIGDLYYGPKYRYVTQATRIVGKPPRGYEDEGEGRLSRVHEFLYRRVDNKLLGEQIQYYRSGGHWFTFGFPPSGDVCPRLGNNGFIAQIFSVGA